MLRDFAPGDSPSCDCRHTSGTLPPGQRVIYNPGGLPFTEETDSMPLSRPIALTLALAAGLAAFVATAGCDAARTAPAGRGLKTGHFDLSPEARRLLPRGAVLYYSKSVTTSFKDWWAIEELNVDTGHTREIISTDTSGLISLQPYSVSPDNRHILVSGRAKKGSPALFELDLKSGAWRKIMDNAVSGYYSPDGSMIVLYTSQGDTEATVSHRVYVINRSGKIIHRIPCASRSCYHPYWSPDGSSVIYVDDDRKIYFYSIAQKIRRVIIEEPQPQEKMISYPIFCSGKIIYFSQDRKRKYSRVLGYTVRHSRLRLLLPGSTSSSDLGDFTDIVGFTCIPTLSRVIAVRDVRGQGLHLVLLQLRPKQVTRLIPPHPSRLMYINPVLTVRQ